jgi:SPP1 family phage portal protein
VILLASDKIAPFNKVKVSDDFIFSFSYIEYFKTQFEKLSERNTLLYDYYIGNVSNQPENEYIIDRNVNFANYICNISSSYFMGKPVTYLNVIDDFYNIPKNNYDDFNNYSLSLYSSIYGNAFEVLYLNETGDISYRSVNPLTCLPVYDDTINENLKYFFRFYEVYDIKTDSQIEYCDFYDDKIYSKYNITNSSLVSTNNHYIGHLPFLEYPNNNFYLSDFEQVISLINEYNLSIVNSSLDFKYFNDAYIVVEGGFGSSLEQLEKYFEKRFLPLLEGQKAYWLLKDFNTSYTELHRNTLSDNIHKISMIPDLTDEKFSGNSSGIAMAYKLFGIEQLASTKERFFNKSFITRFSIINSFYKNLYFNNDDLPNIDIEFTRNIPVDLKVISEVVKNLSSIVDNEILVSQIPFVNNSNITKSSFTGSINNKFDN